MNFFVPSKYVRADLDAKVVVPIVVRPKDAGMKPSEEDSTNAYDSTFDSKRYKAISRKQWRRRVIKWRAHVKASMRRVESPLRVLDKEVQNALLDEDYNKVVDTVLSEVY